MGKLGTVPILAPCSAADWRSAWKKHFQCRDEVGSGPFLCRRCADRYVLDRIHSIDGSFMYSGARLGISEHIDDNRMAFGFRLTKQDLAAIEAVQECSKGRTMIATIGDCGAEYRS